MNVPKLRFKEFNDNWNLTNIRNISSLVTKGTTPKKYEDNGINFVKVENIHDNLISNISSYISDDTHNKELKRSILKENDILFSIAGALGRTAIVKKSILPANTNQANAIIRIENLGNIDLYYLLNRLNHTDITNYINKCQSVGAQPNLSLEQVNNINISLPSINEQNKIGNMLFLLDKKIKLQSKKIEDLKLFKLGKMKMIFKTAEHNFILKNICIIEKGRQINNKLLLNSGMYYMLNGGILPSGFLNEYNTEKNTITISEGGNSCGFVNFNKKNFWCGGHCYKLLNEKIDKFYLYQLLKYNENKIMNLRVGSGLPNIQKKDLESLKLKIHNEEKQKVIANYLTYFDKKNELEIDKLNNLLELKKGLMQNMFI